MRLMGRNMSIIAGLPWLASLLLFSGGCQWANTRGKDATQPGDGDPRAQSSLHADTNSVAASRDCSRLLEKNARLKDDLETRDLDITKLNADLAYEKDRSRQLEQLCRSIQQDLAQAERQFISIEHRLQLKETKASAVSALAEAKLAFDKFKSINGGTGVDLESLQEIERKLEESGQLIQKENYAASVYYSKRVHRMMERSATFKTYSRGQRETRIVSVPKANLRDGPGLDHGVIAQLSFGTLILQVERLEDWSRIETQDGIEGWVHHELIH
jgi:hypothetical protein